MEAVIARNALAYFTPAAAISCGACFTFEMPAKPMASMILGRALNGELCRYTVGIT